MDGSLPPLGSIGFATDAIAEPAGEFLKFGLPLERLKINLRRMLIGN